MELSVPRDRDSSFEPKIVARRQRRLNGIEEIVISLSAKGLTHGEIAAHLAEVYGAEVSKQTITAITDRVMEGLAEWQAPAVEPGLCGAVHQRGQREDPRGPGRQPAHLRRAGRHRGRGARHLGAVGRGARRRGGGQVLAAGAAGDQEPRRPGRVHAGLRQPQGPAERSRRGLPREKTIVQTCAESHLLRNSFKYASKRDWAQIAKDLKPVYTAASESEALDRFAEFSGKWEKRYPAIIRLCITVAVFRRVAALPLSVTPVSEVRLHGVTSFRPSLVTLSWWRAAGRCSGASGRRPGAACVVVTSAARRRAGRG